MGGAQRLGCRIATLCGRALVALQADDRVGDAFAAFCPDFLKTGEIGTQLVGFVDQQFTTRQIAFETDQGVLAVDNQHAVAQMGDLGRCFLRRGEVAIGGQQVLQARMGVPERTAVSHSDAQDRGGLAGQQALDVIEAG